jgi:hypothetical protein
VRVLADFHHEDLYYSLQLLFEKRLGWELYRQVGIEWDTEGYWDIFRHPSTVKQYLELGVPSLPEEPGLRFPLSSNYSIAEEGIYWIKSSTRDTVYRAITLEKFKNTPFDIIISSVPQHIPRFNKLISTYQPNAKHIFQVGNAWTSLPEVSNIMASTAQFGVSSKINICFYHQEFDLETYKFSPPTSQEYQDKKINSYVHWMQGLDILNSYRSSLSEYKFTTYGAGMDSDIAHIKNIAKAMKESLFTWHYKPEGDGYGHAFFSTYACGRPQLVHGTFYRGKLGQKMISDGQTCIDISKHSHSEVHQMVRELSKPDNHLLLCSNARKRFDSMVNFDNEFDRVLKPFLERLR